MKNSLWFISLLLLPTAILAQTKLDKDGILMINGQRRFILGTYHNPGQMNELQKLAQNGINLIHCRADRAALDQAQAAGLFAWINTGSHLDLSENSSARKEKLLEMVKALQDHPSLAVWEAPDEAVWNLYYPVLNDRYNQGQLNESQLDSLLLAYEQASQRLAQGFKQGIALLKSLDPARPIWFNHAPRNSLQQLIPFSALADIVGCDIYPVRIGHTGHSDLIDKNLSSVGAYTDRMQASAPAKPVWMVLQAFSWEQLLRQKPEQIDPMTFPSFKESRWMAYDAILHGAKGLLWWGSSYSSTKAAFWRAILQVTAEIAALEPYLVAPELKKELTVEPVAFASSQPTRVAFTLRQHQNEFLLIVLPEDGGQYVKVKGLGRLNGRRFYEIGTGRSYDVQNGRLLIAPQQEPQVLCTDAKWRNAEKNTFPNSWDRFANHPLKEE